MSQITIPAEKIHQMEVNYRRNLINDLPSFKSPHLIGTVNTKGITNLSIFNSIVHIGANPPLLGFILRPLTVERHTYENIKTCGYFTINSVTEQLMERAHACSGKYPKGVSEFIMTGIKPAYSKIQPAPYVEESPIQIALKIEEEQAIKSNDTRLIVGRIVEIRIEKEMLSPKGYIDVSKHKILTGRGLDQYFTVAKGKRLARITKDSCL